MDEIDSAWDIFRIPKDSGAIMECKTSRIGQFPTTLHQRRVCMKSKNKPATMTPMLNCILGLIFAGAFRWRVAAESHLRLMETFKENWDTTNHQTTRRISFLVLWHVTRDHKRYDLRIRRFQKKGSMKKILHHEMCKKLNNNTPSKKFKIEPTTNIVVKKKITKKIKKEMSHIK